ncbi:unnamed protein product [Nesidiocoris tenuis]|nr:unnamed protein product [Nesidiocoris tenuis]
MTSSPYIAQRVLRQLIEDEGHRFPLGATVLSRSCYVDNIVCSTSSTEEALTLHHELTKLLAAGGFILRKWASSHAEVSEAFLEELKDRPRPVGDMNAIRLLGLEWDPQSDCFGYRVDVPSVEPTKRNILSQIARMYDINGYLSPVIFAMKRLLQDIWLAGLDWDCSLPATLLEHWSNIRSQLPCLNHLRIPRYIMGNPERRSVCLVGFSDASQVGMGASLYLRVWHSDGSVTCNLVKSKSKVAPLKTVSIPRLELCAAVMLSRLVRSVDFLFADFDIADIYLFSDSTTTLAWIQTPPYRLATFVANRVVEITNNSSPSNWRYVGTASNPADLASRGVLANDLVNSDLWWHGPQFLRDEPASWPSRDFHFIGAIPELRHCHLTTTSQELPPVINLMKRCSSFLQVQRVLIYVFRFATPREGLRTARPLSRPGSAEEFRRAITCCIRVTQNHFLADEIKHLQQGEECSAKYRGLTPFLSEDGLVMVGGRLENAPLPARSKHPYLIPYESPLATLICDHYHSFSLHGGPSIVQALIRRTFWIPSIRRLIRSRQFRCKICATFKAKPVQPQMAALPSSRFAIDRCFVNTAIDYAGPVFVKEARRRNCPSTKAYIAVLVCMATKAVHLELVSSLSAEACLAALDRFIGRRGLPETIFSDQGRNFIACARMIRENVPTEQQDVVLQHIGQKGIQWKFAPPYGPNFNGLAESHVKLTKHHLKRCLGSQIFTFEELCTLLIRIESILNSRPLCALTASPDDSFDFLTPGHFLTGAHLLTRPEPLLLDVPEPRLDRWQRVSKTFQSFWKQWKKQFLNTLMQREKWTSKAKNLAPGDLVLISDPHCSPLSWPLARVVRVCPGKDGVVRVAEVKTSTGLVTRPVNKLAILPSY